MTIHSHSRKLTAGYTLVELMIAIALGLILLAGVATIFVQNNRSFNEIDRANQQVENGRYALQIMTDDLSNAGYLAEFNPNLITATPTDKPDVCLFTLSKLVEALPFAVQGYDDESTESRPTDCLSDIRPGTDILVVRRASSCAIGDAGCDAVVAGAPYFQASTCGSSTELSSSDVTNFYKLDTNTASLTLHKKDCESAPPGTVASYHRYLTHIYFIAKNDEDGDGIPTLKRAELGAGGFTIVPMVDGVENLQIEYGIDTDSSGTPTSYTADPDKFHDCKNTPTPPCTTYWRNTVAVKLYLLVRSTTPSPGYSTDKTYYLGLKADGKDNTVGSPFPDAYKRHVYQSVVRLNNVAGRNTP